MTSLRHAALVWMTIVLTTVGAVAVIIAYQLARNEAAEFLDGQLRQIALNVGREAHDGAKTSIHQDPEDDFIIQIWDASGTELRAPVSTLTLPRQPASGFATIKATGEEWRVYTTGDSRRIVQIGQRMRVRQEIAERAAIDAAAPILVVIPLAWLVVSWTLGRMLGRLDGLTRDIAERGTDSKEPILIAEVPTELRPLVAAMNVLIDRLQHALEQQRRFVSDAAHELRTPLTALHLQIENLSGEAKGETLASNAAELSHGIRRASALLEQLLKMARFDAPVEPARRQSIDLCELMTECVADYIPIASSKNVDLGICALEPVTITGVRPELKILLGNLIDNAVRYTPEGGSIDVSVRRQRAHFIVEVSDTGCGVNMSDLPRVFDRFFRAAPPDVEGSGLGLAIVRAIATRHGFDVAIENRTDRSGCIARLSGGGLILS